MKSIEVLGKSVDQAIEIGLFKLNAKREDVRIDILEEGSLFNKAKIKMSIMTDSAEELDIQSKVNEFLKMAKINCESFVEQTEEGYKIEITGEDCGVVIGRHGDCLDAIQYLLSLIINKSTEGSKRVIVDCAGYRAKREDALRTLAARMANKAIKERRPIKLEPMNAFERRIIHTRLQDNSEVTTQSQGVEPNRFLIIYPNGCLPKAAKTDK